MSKLADQWIELFRAGNYGEQGSFSEADLDRIVSNYKPSAHEAPAVIGHPKEDAPAYGWVESLKRSGNLLLGKLNKVDPAFAEMVEAGRFKKRSASFYKTPDGYSLRHVGFLGAQPPVVKGLADCKFADAGGHEVVEFKEMEMADETVTAISSFKTWLEGFMNGSKPAAGSGAVTFSEADVTRIATEAATKAAADAVKPVQAKLDATELRFAEREKLIGTAETRARGGAAVARLKAAGKWVPAFEQMGLSLVFAELAKTTETIEFGEGDGKKKQTPLDTLVNFMEGLSKIVPGGEMYAGQKGGTVPAVKGINPGRMSVDANSVQFAEAIDTYMREHKDVSYFEAATTVERMHPELAKPGGAAVGAV